MENETFIGNPELLKLAMKTIETDLTRWNQQHYCNWGPTTSNDRHYYRFTLDVVDTEDCGTTFCLAGQVSILAGHRPLKSGHWVTPDGDRLMAHELAREALGLSFDQADELFYKATAEVAGIQLPLNGSRPGAWEFYKRHVTDVTGVEFD